VQSPLGLFNCPVYRHVDKAKVGSKHAFSDEAAIAETQENTAKLIQSFDAAHECREVTCLYNNANWFIEDLIRHPEKLDEMVPAEEREDWFL
jgi:hypothetical protein